MRLRLAALVMLASLGACDCGDEPSPDTSPAPAPPPPAPVLAPKRVATAAAFDLVPSGRGALLFVGPPADDGGGVAAHPLGPMGERAGDTISVWRGRAPVAPYAIEIAAAAGGGRTAVAWASQEGPEVYVRVSHASETTFAPTTELGPMDVVTRVTRGNVALAGAPDGTLALLYRRDRGPCAEGGSESCARLAARRIGPEGVSEREGMPLVIPEVCPTPVPGYVWADGTWYYALCAITDGAPETTLYAIRFEPRYAQADQMLSRCDPIGLARVGEGAAVMLGRCEGGFVDGVRVAEMGTERTPLPHVTRTVECSEGRPRAVLTADGQRVQVPLGEATAGLAPLLPDELAPAHARAIWTGQALLVATPIGGEVSLRRYQCQDADLIRTDVIR